MRPHRTGLPRAAAAVEAISTTPVARIATAMLALALVAGTVLFGAVGAVAQESNAAAATLVTGSQGGCSVERAGFSISEPGTLPDMGRGHLVACRHFSSDPRLVGTLHLMFNADFWGDVDTAGIMWFNWELEPADGSGSWAGRGYGIIDDAGAQQAFIVATGSGDFEGQTWALVAEVNPSGTGQTTGIIYEGDPPPGFPVDLLPVPEPPASEG